MMGRFVRPAALVLGIWWLISWVSAVPQAQENLLQVSVQNIRIDQELLADRVFGGGTRPDTWTGNDVLGSPSVVADLWFDNEQLADDIFGMGQRPDDWIGATSSNIDILVRNVRHDLELAADAVLGAGLRPDGWVGGPRLFSCSRTLMNTVLVLERFYNIRPGTADSVLNYCTSVAFDLEGQLSQLTLGDAETEIPAQILALRGDLERLADETEGVNVRPEGWIGNKDINSPTLAADNFTDLELLADEILGVNVRPPDWSGSVVGSPSSAFRSLRFDLEQLADISQGPGVRPRGWQGLDPTLRCDSQTQTLVLLVGLNYDLTSSVDVTSEDFCDAVANEASLLIENPPLDTVEADDIDNRYLAEAEYAFAYLDSAATQYMGNVPLGTQFRAWYRNFGESTMMFVSGDDFALFIDLRWTTMRPEIFQTLPTLEGVRPLTFCDANWCNGPRPTPTPTGSGPLLEIITVATPPATVAPSQVQEGGKQLVNWNAIRVTYLLQRPDIGAAQVTLEICRDTQQIACEPVTSVFNNSNGTAVPAIQQFNGLNVYELPYGYSTNLLIEGPSLFSTDIWLNDPSLGN